MRIERVNAIENYILERNSASLEELSIKFNVSLNTIRRDTRSLIEKGTIKKVYGGVIANKIEFADFQQRNIRNEKNKEAIAEKATSLIEENDIVFIDSGTTTMNMLKTLDRSLPFTVITNSLSVINTASEFENINLVIMGSHFKRKTQSFTGFFDSETISHMNVKKAFMAATGISIKNGLSNSDPSEYEIKRRICDMANSIYLLVDSSKFDKTSLFSYCQIKDLDGIITEKQPPSDYEEVFTQHNIEIILPD